MLQARLWRKLIRVWLWNAGLRLRPLLCRVAHRAVRAAHGTAFAATIATAVHATFDATIDAPCVAALRASASTFDSQRWAGVLGGLWR